jgi:tetratricopeptide (TPR) repeat protein
MRRRPMEFWWVAAFCLIGAAEALSSARVVHSNFDLTLLRTFAAALTAFPILLFAFLRAGRTGCLALLVVLAADHGCRIAGGGQTIAAVLLHLLFPLFTTWMIVYLLNPSTVRLCSGSPATHRRRRISFQHAGLHALELSVGLLGALGARMLGTDLSTAAGAGVSIYAAYCIVFEDATRRLWLRFFPSAEAQIPQTDRTHWRGACRALADKDLEAARFHLAMFSAEALSSHPARLMIAVIDWRELLEQRPCDGYGSLRTLLYDHDWTPSPLDCRAMAAFVNTSNEDSLRRLIDERAAMIGSLVESAGNPCSFFHYEADRCLTRITGQSFAFNLPENWAQWWELSRADWSGDIGAVQVVSRMIRLECDVSADALATKLAGRAEEPMLKELAAQILYLNSMQRATRGRDPIAAAFRQPLRLLLYPKYSDMFGLLHADSHLLENLGMPVKKVTRRLLMRVPLLDYIEFLWARYPAELSSDMPWLVETMTGKKLRRLRAHADFKRWWPAAREAYLRHDRAVCAGLTAMAARKVELAEPQFRAALAEQPGELSSRYNLFLCLMQRRANGEAARVLRELTQLEPRESYWWLVLGEMHRNANQSDHAHAAFRRALELGANPPKVAYHIGLTFARDERDHEAIAHLDRVLGTNPSASRIEELVSQLENEGFWRLAGHYREEAFRRGLSFETGPSDHHRDDDGDLIA